MNEETKDKVWRVVQKTRDKKTADLLTAAAFYLEENVLDRLRIVSCSVLIRPKAKYKQTDFGSFRANPGEYNPAHIRFLIACIPDNVDDIIKNWYNIVQAKTEVSG